MSLAHLNIFLRNANCKPLTDCWRADFVFKTCGGDYVVDFYDITDPVGPPPYPNNELLNQLRTRYPSYNITRLPNYQGETRVSVTPPAGSFIHHLEVDIPPGCYKVWCRVCHGANEETNKVMVIVRCGDEACINLLLDSSNTCGKEIWHPGAMHVVDRGFLVEEEIKPYFKLGMDVAYVQKAQIVQQLNERIVEAQEKGDTELQAKIQSVLDIVNSMPDCC